MRSITNHRPCACLSLPVAVCSPLSSSLFPWLSVRPCAHRCRQRPAIASGCGENRHLLLGQQQLPQHHRHHQRKQRWQHHRCYCIAAAAASAAWPYHHVAASTRFDICKLLDQPSTIQKKKSALMWFASGLRHCRSVTCFERECHVIWWRTTADKGLGLVLFTRTIEVSWNWNRFSRLVIAKMRRARAC